MSNALNEVLRLEALRKSYNLGQSNEVEILHGIDYAFIAVISPP